VQTINSIVHTDGPSQGRTVETADGRPVHVVYDVDRDAFFNYITELAKKVSEEDSK
jgi:purine nucleosidase